MIMLKRLLKKLLTPVVQAVLRDEISKMSVDPAEKTMKITVPLFIDGELDAIFKGARYIKD